MKKLLNDPADVVKESLEGFQAAHGDKVDVCFDPFYVSRKNPSRNKVAVISGGGSGHEPMHAGYVGTGMLDAACPGDVFTSPTPMQMDAAARAVAGEPGVLLIVKNYSGDIMNFEMAAEMLRADGIETASVVTDDDVAVKDSLYTTGRRGVGATVFMEKLCGAAAEEGRTLEEVATVAAYCRENARSIGMALTSCAVPAAGRPTFDIGPDEIEMGVGIHGEPGWERMKMRSANELVDMMLEAVVNDLPYKQGEKAIVMLNGMGGTPLIELYLCYGRLATQARKMGVDIVRCLVGNYITSLEMQGFSLTMMKADAHALALWDAPVDTPGLRWGI